MPRTERIEFRVSPAEKAQFTAAASSAHRSLGDWLRLVAIEALPKLGAVEQASGVVGSSAGSGGGGPAEAPAEPSEEPYVPEWKKRSLGSRAHGPIPKGKP